MVTVRENRLGSKSVGCKSISFRTLLKVGPAVVQLLTAKVRGGCVVRLEAIASKIGHESTGHEPRNQR
ncbi:MAG: hypothetical protein RLY14_2611 [Planctomycetota bacterium]|jgi:hypothetical protein